MNRVIDEIKREIFKNSFEINENDNTACQNLWEAVKTILREKFIAVRPTLKHFERYQGI